MTKKKLLLVYRGYFERYHSDYNYMLGKHFDVKIFPIRFFRDVFKIFSSIKRSDVVLHIFANWTSFICMVFSKLLHKKFIVMAAGMDCSWIEENGKIKNIYISGFDSLWRLLISKIVFNHSDMVLSVSKFAKSGVSLISNPRRMRVVYLGLPYAKNNHMKKDNVVITVGSVSRFNIKKKGFEAFARVSHYFPDVLFYIIGNIVDINVASYLQQLGGDNLYLTGYLTKERLNTFMDKAKVYCQLSECETFGYALAEAMLHKCVPVVTNRGSMPEVVDDTGLLVDYGNSKDIINAIRKALNMSGSNARKKVLEKFSIDKNRKYLCDSIYEVL